MRNEVHRSLAADFERRQLRIKIRDHFRLFLLLLLLQAGVNSRRILAHAHRTFFFFSTVAAAADEMHQIAAVKRAELLSPAAPSGASQSS